MAWTAPTDRETGDLITAAIWNENMGASANSKTLRDGGLALASQAAGDVLYGSSATQLARLAIGTANKVLTSSGSVPQWSTQIVNAALPTNVDLAGTLDVTGAATLDSTLSVIGGSVFNENSADVDFRIESNGNANAFVVNGGEYSGVGTVGIGVSTSESSLTAWVGLVGPATTAGANDSFHRMRINAGGGAVTIPSGTAGLVTSLRVDEPNITATGTVTTAATLYVSGAPTEATSNYVLWVDAGEVRLDNGLVVNEDSGDFDTRMESNALSHFFHLDAGNSTIGIGFSSGVAHDGTVHIQSATAGSVAADSSADNLIVENSGATGISILSPNASTSKIALGSPDAAIGFEIGWTETTALTEIRTRHAGGQISYSTANGVEAMRIDADQLMLIGSTTSVVGNGVRASLEVLGTGDNDSSIHTGRWSANSGASHLTFLKSRNASIGSFTIVADNDRVGQLEFMPDDGVDLDTLAARFSAEVDDASPAAGDIGMAFVWDQMAGGGAALAETMRLSAGGQLSVTSGSVSAPAYTFIGDTDTGTYRPGANAFAITTNGSERMRITSEGKVGIGTTSAGQSLVKISGTITASADTGRLLQIAGGTINMAAYESADIMLISGTIVEASSGTHGRITGLSMSAPAVTDHGSATTVFAATLHIAGAPVVTTSAGNFALKIDGGRVAFGGGVVEIQETTTPNATSGWGKLYTKTDNKLYFQDGAGTEQEVAFV